MNPRTPKQVVLVRVGVDQAYGHWNAPCAPATSDFVYVPIPESKSNAPGMERTYRAVIDPALRVFSERNNIERISLPSQLGGQRMHLDPDFDHLTYGDTARRGRVLFDVEPDDLVVFYSGMRAVCARERLIYGLIGMLTVATVRRVVDVPATEYARNAHTRRADRVDSDIVVTGIPERSGRFIRYLDVGEFRSTSYRVKSALLDAWGGLSVKDGYLQRSVNPPTCRDPVRFYRWLLSQAPQLIQANNPLT